MTLHEWYKQNADATGHATDCRRRETNMARRRALDTERCERCQYLADRLEDAGRGWKVAR